MGGIVEEIHRGAGEGLASAQLRISPTGEVLPISTHDQLLGGSSGQVFLGCVFPADESYRMRMQEEAIKVGTVLASHGVVSRFGVDFLVWRSSPGEEWTISALEINLRMGGTTHPFLALQFLTGGQLDPATGLFRSPSGQTKYYRATDNLHGELYRGLLPEDLIEILTVNKLHYSHATERGVLFHLIGALSQFGKVGLTAIASSREEVDDLYQRTLTVLDGSGHRPLPEPRRGGARTHLKTGRARYFLRAALPPAGCVRILRAPRRRRGRLGRGEGHGDEAGALDLLRVRLQRLRDLDGERGQGIGWGRLHLLRTHPERRGQAEGRVVVHREGLGGARRSGRALLLLHRPRPRGFAGGGPRVVRLFAQPPHLLRQAGQVLPGRLEHLDDRAPFVRRRVEVDGVVGVRRAQREHAQRRLRLLAPAPVTQPRRPLEDRLQLVVGERTVRAHRASLLAGRASPASLPSATRRRASSRASSSVRTAPSSWRS